MAHRTLRIFLFLWVAVIAFADYKKDDRVEYLSTLEKDVLRELNLVRADPPKYAELLEATKPFYAGKRFKRPGEITIITEEGVSAVEEAIQFLKASQPVPHFVPSRGMSLGSRDLVKDQSKTGELGHKGDDGSQVWDRVNRHGAWKRSIGENISYGTKTAREIVMALIIDDGVSGRGHRKNIFNPGFRIVGIACGSHPKFETMCAMALAGAYEEG
jgi:hypothetical protein